MLRNLVGLTLLALLPTCFGCAMCCGTDDYNYATYGGRWQRHDMSHGRVGSIFAPAGADVLAEIDPTVLPSEAAPGRAAPDEAEPGDDEIGDDDITAEVEAGRRAALASFIE